MSHTVYSVLISFGLPILLTACASIRQNALTIPYLLLVFMSPFVPAVDKDTMKGKTARYLNWSIVVSMVNIMCQGSFQVVTFLLEPSSNLYETCEEKEMIYWHLGFVRMQKLSYQALKWVVPDMAVLVYANTIRIMAENAAQTQPSTDASEASCDTSSRRSDVFEYLEEKTKLSPAAAGKFCTILLLGLSGYVVPSLLATPYFIMFLSTCLWLACNKSIGRGFTLLCRSAFLYPAMHVLVIFLYQQPSIANTMPVESLGARLLGLRLVFGASCMDPSDLTISEGIEWGFLSLPFSLLCLYVSMVSSAEFAHDDEIPDDDDDDGYPKVSVTIIQQSLDVIHEKDSLEETTSESRWHTVILPILSATWHMIANISYLATNIGMMLWSITYHSWLTFIFLVGACVLFMLPDRRGILLKMSPLLVVYSTLLLIAQYVFNLDLNDDELPVRMKGWNMKQFGLVRYEVHPGAPLAVQSLFSSIFWLTLRQRYKEIEELEKNRDENVSSVRSKSMYSNLSREFRLTMQRWNINVELSFRDFLRKSWIWVVSVTLFAVGLTGEKVAIYRIVYTALFLLFILTFQVSYRLWTSIMYSFWIVVIFYSMFVLVAIYTYQFDNFPGYWVDMGIPAELQNDIGLEVYGEAGTLLVRLLPPTLFLIFAVIQLQYFHQDFLNTYDILQNCKMDIALLKATSEEDETDKVTEVVVHEPLSRGREADKPIAGGAGLSDISERTSEWKQLQDAVELVQALIWRFLEIHSLDIVFLIAAVTSLKEVCAINMVFMVMVVMGLPSNTAVKEVIVFFMSVITSVVLLSKMIFQIQFITPDLLDNYFDRYLSDDANMSVSSRPVADRIFLPQNNLRKGRPTVLEWIGLSKEEKLTSYVQWNIAVVVVTTIHVVVSLHQYFTRIKYPNAPVLPTGTYFHGVTYEDLDTGLVGAIKYFANYIFYRFGVEVTLGWLVVVIANRMDIVAVIYSGWLVGMFLLQRHTLSTVWPFFMLCVAVITLMQYIMCMGLPLTHCKLYPWSLDPVLQRWLVLPDCNPESLDPWLMMFDVFLLALACHQQDVFRRQPVPNGYPGGDNVPIAADVCDPWDTPVSDFMTYQKSWLDSLKRVVFISFYWVTLAIVYMAGTFSVNVFALGYLFCSFMFLWRGTDFYLMTRSQMIRWWNGLLTYNVVVIGCKTCLHLIGCLYINHSRICWAFQTIGITCLLDISTLQFRHETPDARSKSCMTPEDVSAMFWDALSFWFLIFCRRILSSYYIYHVVENAKAEAVFANSGAILYDELVQASIQEEQELERKILLKLKEKMTQLKQKNRRTFVAQRTEIHEDVTRSGDYHMFEDDPASTINDMFDEEGFTEVVPIAGYQLGELIRAAAKTNIKTANMLARQARGVGGVLRRRRSNTRSMWCKWSLQMLIPVSRYETAMTQEDLDITALNIPRGPKPPSGKKTWAQRKESLKQLAVFVLEMVISVGIGLTNWLYHLSASYRYVSKFLAEEMRKWKENRMRRNTLEKDLEEAVSTSLSKIDALDRPVRRVVRLAVESSSPTQLDSCSVTEFPKKGTCAAATRWRRAAMTKSKEEYSTMDEKHLLVSLGKGLWCLVMSHTELLCYLMIFLNHIISANLLSLPLPLLVFFWGSLAVPRPGRTFWVTVITYTDFIVLIKCLLKLQFVPDEVKDMLALRFYATDEKDTELSSSVYDLVLLIAVFAHRHILRSLGQWEVKHDMKFVDALQEQPKRTSNKRRRISPFLGYLRRPGSRKSSASRTPSPKRTPSPGSKAVVPQRAMSAPSAKTTPERSKQDTPVTQSRSSFTILSPINRASPHESSDSWITAAGSTTTMLPTPPAGEPSPPDTEDSSMTGIRRRPEHKGYPVSNPATTTMHRGPAASVFLIIRRFAAQVIEVGSQIGTRSVRGVKEMKNFFRNLLHPELKSGADVYSPMFFCDFINFLIILFWFSSFGGQGEVQSYIKENRVPLNFLVFLLVQFFLIMVDRAIYLRKFIRGKLVFQLLSITVVHGYIFVAMPYLTGKSFRSQFAPRVWYFIKCIYFLLSAIQIRAGYPTRILGNFICKHYTILHMILFKCFMLIPLLYELRALMDWIMTDTSMSIFDWLKVEDIFARTFELKCFRIYEHNFPQFVGQKKKKKNKVFVGCGLLFLLLGIVWFPLGFYTIGATVSVANPPVAVKTELAFEGFAPFFHLAAHQEDIKELVPEQWERQRDRSYYEIMRTFLSRFDNHNVVMVKMNGSSMSTWNISPPSMDNLKEWIASDDDVRLELTFRVARRKAKKSDSENVTEEFFDQRVTVVPAYSGDGVTRNPDRVALARILDTTGNGAIRLSLKFDTLFPRAIQVTQYGDVNPAKSLRDKEQDGAFAPIRIEMHMKQHVRWWHIKSDCTSWKADCDEGLDLFVFSEKMIWSSLDIISRQGIIGLYTTFVLVIGNVVRRMFFNISPIIMYRDMPNVDRILQLCLDIYLVRESRDFFLEEDLFAQLLFLYRSPETMIKWSRDNVWVSTTGSIH